MNVIDFNTGLPLGQSTRVPEYFQVTEGGRSRRRPTDLVDVVATLTEGTARAALPLASALWSQSLASLRSREDVVELHSRRPLAIGTKRLPPVELSPHPERPGAWTLEMIAQRSEAEQLLARLRALGVVEASEAA